jgi:deazaflavin-dependent oxidoreductase (nitroreductase family)
MSGPGVRALGLLGTRRGPPEPTPPTTARRIKRKLSRAVTSRIVNPPVRWALERIPRRTGWAVLETTGRRTGIARRTPVGDGLRGDAFWIVTEHGWGADYVRNIACEPRVRVNIAGRWRSGTAHILPADDPYRRLRRLRRPVNDAALLLVGTEQLTIRIDLDSAVATPPPAAPPH